MRVPPLVLAWLLGCESTANLDPPHIVHDASTVDPDAGTSESADDPDGGPDQNAELRDLCVDTINMYRASLDLAPLARGSALQERCADEGAAIDGAMNEAHYAARNRGASCQGAFLRAENSCPNWGFGPLTEHATVADALVHCIEQMWGQGMPPVPVEDCAQDLEAGGCYEQHGNWINMTNPRSKFVACGFALLGEDTVWINQDFATR